MAFPQDPLPLVSEILIDGAWVEVSRVGGASDVRAQQQVTISRGRRDIQGTIPPAQADFTLNNRDGRFTNDNPLSPYYKKLGLFTQVRHRIDAPSLAGWAQLPGTGNARLSTPDTPALDVTGDIDLRIEIDPYTWNLTDSNKDTSADVVVLAEKLGSTSSEISWFWGYRGDGRMYFFWTTGGTLATVKGAFISSKIPLTKARTALRVTLDVDNGSGGYTVAFYYSTSIDGTWTLVQQQVVGGGTTSIYSGAGPLDIGGAPGYFGGHRAFGGRVYAFQARNGINGSVIANADMRQLLPGVTSFTDSATRVWTLNSAVILSDKIRFHGEMEAMPQEWDSTGKDCWVPVHAGDLLQRLGNDASPSRDAISQFLDRYLSTTTGHWPLASGGATSESTIPGSGPATVSGFTFSSSSELAGSSGYAAANATGAFLRGQAKVTPAGNDATFLFWGRAPSIPSAPPLDQRVLFSVNTANSTVRWWEVQMFARDSLTIYAYAADGTLLHSGPTGLGFPVFDPQKWFLMSLSITQSGGNISYTLAWNNFSTTSYFGVSNSFAGTVGRFNGFTFAPQANLTDLQYAHPTIMQQGLNIASSDILNASTAFTGELAANRFTRMCASAGITSTVDGWAQDSAPVGPQPIDTFLNVLRDLEKVDGGLLVGTRSQNGLTYITRNRITQQLPGASFSHSASHFSSPPKPVPDSFGVVNDVTVTRKNGGGGARTIITDGPRGTAAVGTVAGGDSANVVNLDAALSLSGFLAALGTYDAPRFPEVPFRLERTSTVLGSAIAEQITGLDVGKFFTILDLPPHQAPGPVELLTQGYSEVLGNRTMQIVFNSSAYGPWRTGAIEGVLDPLRWAAANTKLLPATSSETVLTFVTPGDTMVINEAGTFETALGVGGWVGTNGSVALSSAQALSGTYSLLLTAAGGTATAAARQSAAYKATVTPGVQYRAEFLAYAPVAIASFQANIDWATAGNSFISGSATVSAPLAAGSWTYFSVTATAPATAGLASYGATITGTPAAGVQVYIDNVHMYRTDRVKSARWITSSETPTAFPMDIMIAGEKMTVSAIHGQGEVQCAHVTRAVNGIAKAHVRGADVQLARFLTWGR